MGDADNKHKHDTRAQITYPTRYCRQNTQTPMPHHHGKTEKYYHKVSNLTHRYQHKKRILVDKRKRQRERDTHTHTQHQTRSMSNHRPQKRPITDQQIQNFPQGKNPQIACFLTPPRHRNVTLNMSICFPVYYNNINDPKPLMQESTRRPTRPLPPIDLAPAWYNRWKDPVR